jgi:hypothetical protein
MLLSQLHQLGSSHHYQILFMVSTILYHSTDYFLIATPSAAKEIKGHLFLSIFT